MGELLHSISRVNMGKALYMTAAFLSFFPFLAVPFNELYSSPGLQKSQRTGARSIHKVLLYSETDIYSLEVGV